MLHTLPHASVGLTDCISIVISALKISTRQTTIIILWLPLTVKPIFHCNAKQLTLGSRVGLDPQRDEFALLIVIPTCWYPKRLTYPTQSLASPVRFYNPQREPQCEPVEYGLRCMGMQELGLHWGCKFHVVCVNFICVGYPARTRF